MSLGSKNCKCVAKHSSLWCWICIVLKIFWEFLFAVILFFFLSVVFILCILYWNFSFLKLISRHREVVVEFKCGLVRHNVKTFNAIFNNYSPKWRWIVLDIYRAAKRGGKYPPLFTSTSPNNCFSTYHTSWINSRPKNNFIFDYIPQKFHALCDAHSRSQNHMIRYKSGDQLKENEVKWSERLEKFENF